VGDPQGTADPGAGLDGFVTTAGAFALPVAGDSWFDERDRPAWDAVLTGGTTSSNARMNKLFAGPIVVAPWSTLTSSGTHSGASPPA
jgi:hypothetical protein